MSQPALESHCVVSMSRDVVNEAEVLELHVPARRAAGALAACRSRLGEGQS